MFVPMFWRGSVTVMLMFATPVLEVASRASSGFLDNPYAGLSLTELSADLQGAMHEVLGCDVGNLGSNHEASLRRLETIEAKLKPMWNTMPTNNHGRLDWRSLRYVAHRYFMQESSLLIRGFEPSALLNESFHGVAQILTTQVPKHMDVLLGGAHSKKGYSFSDSAAFVGALERLVFDAESELLTDMYNLHRMPTESRMGIAQVRRLLESYVVHWVYRPVENVAVISDLLVNRTHQIEDAIDHWSDLKEFVDGRLRTLDFEQSRNPRRADASLVMMGRYSFDDVHEIVGGISRTFSKFWQSECSVMKQQLVDMDKDGTGRVKLSDFYGTGLEKDWRFGESEEYLRDLGVLDETSTMQGKQVMISNYLQAASNCIVSTPHYLVCCENECETLMREIENEIKAPMAPVEEVLRVVANLSSSSSVDDEPPALSGTLTDQLMVIADSYKGKVPLHGRLFAQWLHFAFPRECPFPHTAGKFAHHTLTPDAYGDKFEASQHSMLMAVAEAPATVAKGTDEPDEQWMSQWTAEEELFADYTHLLSPWDNNRRIAKIAIAAAILLLSICAVVVVGTGAAEKIPATGTTARAPMRGHVV